MRRKAFPIDYLSVANFVDGWVPEWRLAGFDGVVAIARGGLIAGTMAAAALSLPLYSVHYARQERRVGWFSSAIPPNGSKLLLVEDIAGRGNTLADCLRFLAADYRIEVCALVSDRYSTITPRWSNLLPGDLRAWFPWERESISETFDQSENNPAAKEYAYRSWAIDLDGVLLPDIADEDYRRDLEQTLARRDQMRPAAVLPPLELNEVAIVTGRPECDRERTRSWLDRHGFHGELIMRDPDHFPVENTPEFKAHHLHLRCFTHYLESCPRQAIRIAAAAPVAKVFWWSGDGTVHLVKAADAALPMS